MSRHAIGARGERGRRQLVSGTSLVRRLSTSLSPMPELRGHLGTSQNVSKYQILITRSSSEHHEWSARSFAASPAWEISCRCDLHYLRQACVFVITTAAPAAPSGPMSG